MNETEDRKSSLKTLKYQTGLISVIPTYNREKFIKRAVDSVLSQTFKNLELIIVDDGSNDGTLELLASYEDPRITILSTPAGTFMGAALEASMQASREAPMRGAQGAALRAPLGVSVARNLGITRSQGEYIAFLDSDDEWHPTKLKKQYDLLSNANELWVHCNETWLRNGSIIKQLPKHKKAGGDQFHRSLQLCCIGASCVMIHKTIFEACGTFRTDFAVCEDYDFWLRILWRFPIAFIEESLVTKHAGHDGQLSFQDLGQNLGHKAGPGLAMGLGQNLSQYLSMDEYRVRTILSLLEEGRLSNYQKELATAELVKKVNILERGFRKHSNSEKADFYLDILHRHST